MSAFSVSFFHTLLPSMWTSVLTVRVKTLTVIKRCVYKGLHIKKNVNLVEASGEKQLFLEPWGFDQSWKLRVNSHHKHWRPRPGVPLQLRLQPLGATVAWAATAVLTFGATTCYVLSFRVANSEPSKTCWEAVFSVTSSSANLLRPVCAAQGG